MCVVFWFQLHIDAPVKSSHHSHYCIHVDCIQSRDYFLETKRDMSAKSQLCIFFNGQQLMQISGNSEKARNFVKVLTTRDILGL